MHLTFEEYFAALYIVGIDDFNEQLNLIKSHLHEPRWNEPILLALGKLSGLLSQRVNKLVEMLFSGLDEYKPAIDKGDIRIKNTSLPDPVLCFPVASEDSTDLYRESDLMLKDLMFVGQVLNQVELQGRIRKLVSTFSKVVNSSVSNSLSSSIGISQALANIELFAKSSNSSLNLP